MSRPSLFAAVADFTTLRARSPLRASSVRGCPPGDGAAVLVLPGLFGTDRQTRRFRNGLQRLGYAPLPWSLGLNLGPTPRLLEHVAARVSGLARDHGPLQLVGFGMGGIFARWAAQSRTGAVAGVVTVNTPFRAPVETAWRPLRPFLAPQAGLDTCGLAFMVRQPPEQPWAALYSRRDGVVGWTSCMDPAYPDRCTETRARHASCMRDEEVFRAVAGWLGKARPEMAGNHPAVA
jgi:pimeloyl-ACP methyl ester carboxylesterase